ncbi:Abi family protein [Catenovulum agarivorans]|uniref:Abi family protein n=1 Tax=Catenovulum agarivorans TaxID=1172192 RepID=UPI00030F1348|nr:Abi family protein [Catenovulum agarivorans]
MSYKLYAKQYKAPQELVAHLKSKNLTINDEQRAIALLSSISYYRFKIYLYPLLNPESGYYQPKASFEQGLELYRFDDELRDLIYSIIGRIEIKFIVCNHNLHYLFKIQKTSFLTTTKIIIYMLHQDYKPLKMNRLYLILVMLQLINKSLCLSENIKNELESLFAKYPTAKDKSHSAGFPNNWEMIQFGVNLLNRLITPIHRI